MNVDVVTIFDVVGSRYENHRKAKHVHQTPHLWIEGGIVLTPTRVLECAQDVRTGRDVRQRPFVASAAAANGAEGSRPRRRARGIRLCSPSRAEVTGKGSSCGSQDTANWWQIRYSSVGPLVTLGPNQLACRAGVCARGTWTGSRPARRTSRCGLYVGAWPSTGSPLRVIRTSLWATLTVNPRRVSMGLSRLPSPVVRSSTHACDWSWWWFTSESLL